MLDLIDRMIGSLGGAGVALLMFLENVFPPVPSEIIMPLAGFVSSRGSIGFWTVVIAGTAGSLAGATLISLPAGFANMSVPAFLLWSTLGTFGWTAALTLSGRLLGTRYEQVSRFVDPVAWAMLGILAGIYVYRVVRWRRSNSPA